MIKQSSAGKIFSEAYKNIEKIPFQESWVTEEGYYDNIHSNLVLNIGEMKGAYDDFTDRRMVLIGTRLGIICIYDKFPKQTINGFHHVNLKNCKNKLLNILIPAATIGKRDMVTLLGSWNNFNNNIGFKIENIYKEMELTLC
jgi:hypothetical protein